MKVEIVEFYPRNWKQTNGTKIIGTLHVYLQDFDIDIRGVKVVGRKYGYKIRLPHTGSISHETKKRIVYPIVSFGNQQTTKDLESLIKQQCSEFIDQWFKGHPEEKASKNEWLYKPKNNPPESEKIEVESK